MKQRIAVIIGTSLGWREKVMRGIASYAHEHGPWHVYTAPEGTEDTLFFSENYRWDGLIVRVTSARILRRILRMGVPAVSIGSTRYQAVDIPRVKTDDARLVSPVVRHFTAAGLRQFAYCGFLRSRTAEDRGPAFARALAAMGLPCAFYADHSRLAPTVGWQSRQRDLAKWLAKLPKPVGVLTWNADVACQVVEACHVAGIAVPDEAAVVSGDEDRVKLELCSPTVSAVEIPAERIGFEAADLLHRLMAGEAPPVEPVLVPPSGSLLIRESSDTSHHPDRQVQLALRYLREHAAEAIRIDDAAKHVHMSRRRLERLFRKVLGRTPHRELLAARLEIARRLLEETSFTTARVAAESGLGSASYLAGVFRREMGTTPIEFRKRLRT